MEIRMMKSWVKNERGNLKKRKGEWK